MINLRDAKTKWARKAVIGFQKLLSMILHSN